MYLSALIVFFCIEEKQELLHTILWHSLGLLSPGTQNFFCWNKKDAIPCFYRINNFELIDQESQTALHVLPTHLRKRQKAHQKKAKSELWAHHNIRVRNRCWTTLWEQMPASPTEAAASLTPLNRPGHSNTSFYNCIYVTQRAQPVTGVNPSFPIHGEIILTASWLLLARSEDPNCSHLTLHFPSYSMEI